jgi:hypothetical protein
MHRALFEESDPPVRAWRRSHFDDGVWMTEFVNDRFRHEHSCVQRRQHMVAGI